MNSDTLKGQWKRIVGSAKTEWAKLTEDDWKEVEGNYDQLLGRIQEKYGIARDKAEEQLDAFIERVSGAKDDAKKALDSAREKVFKK